MDLFRYREKHTPQAACRPSQRVSVAPKFGEVSFYRLGNFTCERVDLLVTGQYFGHLMRRAISLEETQMLGKIEGRKRRG